MSHRLLLALRGGVALALASACSAATDHRASETPDAAAGSGPADSAVPADAGSVPAAPAVDAARAVSAPDVVGRPEAGAAPADARADLAPVAIDPCVAAGNCPAGTWVRRDLPGFGGMETVQTVLVDPVRASDFYAFVGYNGGPTNKVYRSTDFGDSWRDVNKTAEKNGNPWGASIDPNPGRDPATPPTMWAPSGYGASGAWKSTDGGQTWVRSAGADQAFGPYNPFGAKNTDLYHIQILPDDPPNHVLATYHYGFKNAPDGGFGESWDGGATWVIHPPPPGIGTSHYVIPIGATTWAVIAQSNNGKSGIWRTTTAGRVGGTAAAKFRDGTISADAWQKVDALEHTHGSHQNLVLKNGAILVTGEVTGARSLDGGATWTHFTNNSWAPPRQFMSSAMTNIAVTERFIYTNALAGPNMARAPLDNPIGADKWTVAYTATPAGMTRGGSPFGMASCYAAGIKKWVIIAGADRDGIWKYVEP
jgi:hypothetical protein